MYEARWHCNCTGILQSYFHVPAETAVRRSCRPVGCIGKAKSALIGFPCAVRLYVEPSASYIPLPSPYNA